MRPIVARLKGSLTVRYILYFITYKAYHKRIDFVKKARLEHVFDDLLPLVNYIDFGQKTAICLNNKSIYSHQDF